MIHSDTKVLALNLTESLKEYQWLVNYSKVKQPKILHQELSICEQMTELLPLKIKALSQGIRLS